MTVTNPRPPTPVDLRELFGASLTQTRRRASHTATYDETFTGAPTLAELEEFCRAARERGYGGADTVSLSRTELSVRKALRP